MVNRLASESELEELHKPHCKATTLEGEYCGAPPVHGSDYCFVHDPNLADKRNAARTHGGRRYEWSKKLGKECRSVEDVLQLLDNIRETLEEMDATVQVAGAMKEVAKTYLAAITEASFGERLAALEEELHGDAAG